MAITEITLYRSLTGDDSKLRVRDGVPDAGMLDPQWKAKSWVDRDGNKKTRNPDVRILTGPDGPEVQPDGKGTSLHDVSGWFPTREFVIPAGTTYKDCHANHCHQHPDRRHPGGKRPGSPVEQGR